MAKNSVNIILIFFSYVVAHEFFFKMVPVAKNLTIQKYPFCRLECGHACQKSPFSNELLVHNHIYGFNENWAGWM